MSKAADLFAVDGLRTVVTGAASGLGQAMAEAMADGGARVTLTDLDGGRLDEVVGELATRGGDVRGVALDVTDSDAVRAVFDEVAAEQGGVDVAFANAGISREAGVLDEAGGLEALDREKWDAVLGVNLNGVLFTMQEAARHMKRQGSGRIVVTASTAGFGTDPFVGYSYSATKAAVMVMVRQAAFELAARGGDVRGVALDVTDSDAVRAVFGEVAAEQGGVDVAFANAGISLEAGVLDEAGGLEALDRAKWDAVLGVNLNGVLFTMQEAARHMKRQGSGRIVVTASTAGFGTDPFVGYSYSATKAAVMVMVRQAAFELAGHGVHVNAIAPGPFRTRIGEGAPPIPDEAWAEIVALGRLAEPEELKGLALLLASPASSFMTGAIVPIDGGQLLMSHGA